MQVDQICTKQNSLANMLLRSQYAKINNKYIFLQIAITFFKIFLKISTSKFSKSKYQLVFFPMILSTILKNIHYKN